MDSMSRTYAACACHDRKCVLQLHPEDEPQRALVEPGKPDSEIEGKQQLQLMGTRVVSAKPLSNCDFILI